MELRTKPELYEYLDEKYPDGWQLCGGDHVIEAVIDGRWNYPCWKVSYFCKNKRGEKLYFIEPE